MAWFIDSTTNFCSCDIRGRKGLEEALGLSVVMRDKVSWQGGT